MLESLTKVTAGSYSPGNARPSSYSTTREPYRAGRSIVSRSSRRSHLHATRTSWRSVSGGQPSLGHDTRTFTSFMIRNVSIAYSRMYVGFADLENFVYPLHRGSKVKYGGKSEEKKKPYLPLHVLQGDRVINLGWGYIYSRSLARTRHQMWPLRTEKHMTTTCVSA